MRTRPDITLKEKDRRAIAAAVQLLRQRFPVEQVILFGSKARGTDEEESDIDLLVLTSRQVSWQECDAMIDALFDIELAHGVVISPLVISTQEWSQGPHIVLPIHDEIEEHGVRL